MSLRLILLLILTLASVTSPIFGGLIVRGSSQFENDEFRTSGGTSSTEEKETPWQAPVKHLKSNNAALGMTVNVVSTITTSQTAIGCGPILVFKAKPPLESVFSLSEWLFRPDVPILKIPKVPIVWSGDVFLFFAL